MRCEATTKSGERCKREAQSGMTVCCTHAVYAKRHAEEENVESYPLNMSRDEFIIHLKHDQGIKEPLETLMGMTQRSLLDIYAEGTRRELPSEPSPDEDVYFGFPECVQTDLVKQRSPKGGMYVAKPQNPRSIPDKRIEFKKRNEKSVIVKIIDGPLFIYPVQKAKSVPQSVASKLEREIEKKFQEDGWEEI